VIYYYRPHLGLDHFGYKTEKICKGVCDMKFCPFCGASVLDDTVSFCSECGKSLSISAKQPEEKEPSKPAKKKDSGSSTHLKKKKPKHWN